MGTRLDDAIRQILENQKAMMLAFKPLSLKSQIEATSELLRLDDKVIEQIRKDLAFDNARSH